MQLDDMTNEELLAHYIIETRGSGHFLAYQDYELIKGWLKAANDDADHLLLILSELLPAYFQKSRGAGARLAGVSKSVYSKLRAK